MQYVHVFPGVIDLCSSGPFVILFPVFYSIIMCFSSCVDTNNCVCLRNIVFAQHDYYFAPFCMFWFLTRYFLILPLSLIGSQFSSHTIHFCCLHVIQTSFTRLLMSLSGLPDESKMDPTYSNIFLLYSDPHRLGVFAHSFMTQFHSPWLHGPYSIVVLLLSRPSHNVLPLLGTRLCPLSESDGVFGGSKAHQVAASRGGRPLFVVRHSRLIVYCQYSPTSSSLSLHGQYQCPDGSPNASRATVGQTLPAGIQLPISTF